MKGIRTSAPGKVVVSGEYAVLDGAPAIVMAVDRRAAVHVAAAPGDWHTLSAPGLLGESIDFQVDEAGAVSLRSREAAPADLTLVWQVWNAVEPRPGSALRLELDTRPFFDAHTRAKLGFGSSAALAVALTFALMHAAGKSGDAAAIAGGAHRAWQDGRGSGVDVAAALNGGILAYRVAAARAPERLGWPTGLHHAVLWSGRPARTADKVAKLQSNRDAGRRTADRLMRVAAEVVDSWRVGEPQAILETLVSYRRALESFGVDHDLGIFDAGHRELAEAADGRRVVYKPCGAGGGDIGLAVALDEAHLDRFLGRARALGFVRLNVAPDMRGVEEHPDP